MTHAERNRQRRIETLVIVLGLLGVITVAASRPYMEQPRPISGAVRG
jgi:predicted nucleic acid-binding protein